MYHPGENYRTLSYDTPSAHSSAPGMSGTSPVNAVVNGGTNNMYKPVQAGQLDTIGEEGSVQLKNPHAQGSQGSAVRSRPRRGQNPTGPQQGNVLVDNANQSVEENKKQKTGSQVQNDSLTLKAQEEVAANQSKTFEVNPGYNVSKKSDISNDSHVSSDNQTVPPKKPAPSFSINGGDSDNSPSPKGKFYI